MDRDEFERIKQEEKEHLRTKKRMEKTLSHLRRRRRIGDAVSAMARSASALLRENDALVRTLSLDAARSQARLDLAIDDIDRVEAVEYPDTPSDLPPGRSESRSADDEDDVESRAEQIVQQMKMATGPQHRHPEGERRRTARKRPSHPAETESARRAQESEDSTDEKTSASGDAAGTSATTLPEKTIGRMDDAPTTNDPAESDRADSTAPPEIS